MDEQRTRDERIFPVPTPSTRPSLSAPLWPAAKEKFKMGNSRRPQPASRKQQQRGGQSSAVPSLPAGPTTWAWPCIATDGSLLVLVQFAAWNCGVSCEQSFLVLVACVCSIHLASDRKQGRVISVESLVKLRDLYGSACKKGGLKAAAVATGFCLWLGAAYSLFNQHKQVVRPGAASGVADAVWLFFLSMLQCIVHPIDYLFDMLLVQ